MKLQPVLTAIESRRAHWAPLMTLLHDQRLEARDAGYQVEHVVLNVDDRGERKEAMLRALGMTGLCTHLLLLEGDIEVGEGFMRTACASARLMEKRGYPMFTLVRPEQAFSGQPVSTGVRWYGPDYGYSQAMILSESVARTVCVHAAMNELRSLGDPSRFADDLIRESIRKQGVHLYGIYPHPVQHVTELGSSLHEERGRPERRRSPCFVTDPLYEVIEKQL